MAKRNRRNLSTPLNLPGVFPESLQVLAKTENLPERYEYVRHLNDGKTGSVHLIRSIKNPNHQVCLKTVKESLHGTKDAIDKVRDSLSKECEILEPLCHRCLPTIYEKNALAQLPYYVCSFHPGMTFAKFSERGLSLGLDEAFFVIRSLFDVVKYVHANGRTHCDLHANNILIDESVFKHGILVIDFGSGHRQSDTSDFTVNAGNVNFKPPASVSRNRTQVARTEANQEFRESDLSALGKLLQLMINSFMKQASHATKRAYIEFASRLNNFDLTKWEDIEEALKSVVDPYRSVTYNHDLFKTKNRAAPLSIPLPVHGRAIVGDFPLAVINCGEFQRLRGLRQLSFCDWFFPGATHTRFEHSLGVFEVARNAVESLIHDSQFRARVKPAQVRGFLLAALVHDIGHYPFAHVLEQYAAGRFPGDLSIRKAVSHEEHTMQLLEGDAELNQVIRTEWSEEAKIQAIKVLRGQVPVLSNLLDGPIDIDKIDYLERDSHHCGIRYGNGVDIPELLSSMCSLNDGNSLGISESGIVAVEGLMVLQNQMLSAVYWHSPVRGLICMFHAIIAHLVKLETGGFIEMVSKLKRCKSEIEALTDVLAPMAKMLKEAKKREQVLSLINAFIYPQYKFIYRPIARFSVDDIPSEEAITTVYATIVTSTSGTNSSVPINWDNLRKLRKAFIDEIASRQIEVEDIDIAIDVPYGKSNRPMLKVKMDRGDEVDFASVSHLQASIFSDPTRFLAPIRVYVAPRLFEQIGGNFGAIAKEAEKKYLSHGYAI